MNTKPEITTTPVPGTKATAQPSANEAIATLLADARASFDSDYVPVAACVDWLLDAYNLADDPLKDVIARHLPNYSHGNLRTIADIEATFDAIEASLATAELG